MIPPLLPSRQRQDTQGTEEDPKISVILAMGLGATTTAIKSQLTILKIHNLRLTHH